MDVFLLFLVLAVIGFALAINTRLLLHYQKPEDSGFASSVVVKVIIVLSLTLAWLVNLLLPVDVRNSRPTPGFLDMQFLWSFAFIAMAVFLVVIVPGAIFYHEVEGDDTVKRKKRHVVIYLALTFIFAVSVVAISFAFLSTAALPVEVYSCQEWQDADAPRDDSKICSSGKPGYVEVQVGFHIYTMAALCFADTHNSDGLEFTAIDLHHGTTTAHFSGLGDVTLPLKYADRKRSLESEQYSTVHFLCAGMVFFGFLTAFWDLKAARKSVKENAKILIPALGLDGKGSDSTDMGIDV